MTLSARRRDTIGVAALYVLGILHLLAFFGTPDRPRFIAADWPKEYRYYSVLQQAVTEGRIPDYVSWPLQETRKFLAVPEVTWSPQIVLLRWLPIDVFVAANTSLLFTAGFVGCLGLRRRFGLSFVPFALLATLLLANGHVMAHLAVGHSMWSGYFLLPFFLGLVLDVAERRPGDGRPVRLGLVCFAVLLQGAYHVFVWMLLFLLLTAVFRPALRTEIGQAISWALALGLCRLVPAAFVLGQKRDVFFFSGYPTPLDLLLGLTWIGDVATPKRGGFVALGWWEFDIYVGVVGAAWLGWFGLYQGMRRGLWGLGPPAAVLALLSMSYLYLPFTLLPLPFLSTQRVSSRLMALPVALLVVAAARRMEESREAVPRRSLGAVILAGTLVGIAAHSWVWRVESVEARWPGARDRDLSIQIENSLPDGSRDPAYERSTRGAAAVSAALLLWALARGYGYRSMSKNLGHRSGRDTGSGLS